MAYRVFPFLGLVALLLCGCNPNLASVKGRVTCNGKPVAQAAITFSPVAKHEGDVEPGKAGSGFTDEDGNFVLSTFSNYDGALIGAHSVTVSLDDTNPARCQRLKQFNLEVKAGSNDFPIELSN